MIFPLQRAHIVFIQCIPQHFENFLFFLLSHQILLADYLLKQIRHD